MEKVLYLSYTGLLEPLGQSQILSYLTRLSSKYQFTIISFEKKNDFENKNEVSALKDECLKYGINWQPQIYHHKPRLLATVFDLLVLLYFTWKCSRANKVQLIHCRSYIPTIAAWLVGKFTKTPFVFDMRALWPEEIVAAGRLKRNSLVHKILIWVEARLLRDAAHVVSLTQVAVDYLQEKDTALLNQKFSVITTCVDLDKFDIDQSGQKLEKIGTMGTVLSGWFHVDWLFLTLQRAFERNSQISFKIITRDSKEELLASANEYDIPLDLLDIRSSASDAIAENISDMKVGLLYFTSGISKLGSAPTRMGEFLACGIPVIGNRGVGDMADLIEQYNVGIVIENAEQASINAALEQLDVLYEDNDLPARCRKAAEDYFSADKGAVKYHAIYKSCLS